MKVLPNSVTHPCHLPEKWRVQLIRPLEVQNADGTGWSTEETISGTGETLQLALDNFLKKVRDEKYIVNSGINPVVVRQRAPD